MNCRTCEYPLWNLKSRACPECNAPFAPSQFTFRRHSIAFCCPHCDQPYFGTGEGGHLDPRAFTCTKCGQPLHEDEMVLRPGPGVAEERTRYRPVPWLDPGIRSFLVRLVQTSFWALFLPGRLGQRLPVPERPLAAFGFAASAVLVMLIPALLLVAVVGAFLPVGGFGPGLVAVTIVFGVVVWALIGLLPWAGLAHLALRMTGSNRGGFKRTLECLAYGVPACLPMAVPAVGLYLTPLAVIYWTVVSTVMLRAGQRVSWGRAIFAAAVFPVLLAVGLGLFIGLVVMPAYRSAMATMAAMQVAANPSQQAAAISSALHGHAGANAGAGPVHMSELLLSGAVTPPDLLSGQTFRTDARGSIGGINLMHAGGATTGAIRAAVAAARPAGEITAHRLGDVVFTYHGIDLNAPVDPGLWTLVITTEPTPFSVAAGRTTVLAPGSSPTARPALAAARADGAVEEIADADFGAALDAQNALRVSKGLAALPDPRQLVANGFTTPADAPAAPTTQPPP